MVAKPSSDSLHPTPYTLHPTPYTLHPTPEHISERGAKERWPSPLSGPPTKWPSQSLSGPRRRPTLTNAAPSTPPTELARGVGTSSGEVVFFSYANARITVLTPGNLGPASRGTSLIRNSTPLGPYSRTMPRALRWS
jgi:hypothetical protein